MATQCLADVRAEEKATANTGACETHVHCRQCLKAIIIIIINVEIWMKIQSG